MAMGGVAVHEVAVAAADAGGADLHQDLAGLRLVKVDLADIERLTNFPQNGSFYLQNGSLLMVTARMVAVATRRVRIVGLL